MPAFKYLSGLSFGKKDPKLVNAISRWKTELIQQLISMDASQHGVERMRRRRYDEGTFTRTGGLAWAPAQVAEQLNYHIPEGYNPENPSVDRLYLRIIKTPEIHQITETVVDELIRSVEELGNEKWDGPVSVRFHLIGYFPENGLKSVATPDCIHQDGVRWTSIVLVDRWNIEGATNLFFPSEATGKRIENPEVKCTAEYSLKESLDVLIWNDAELSHYVTPMGRALEQEGAWRVILVVDVEPQATSTFW